MRRKIIWSFLISIFSLALVFWGSSYYLHYSNNQETPNDQSLGAEEFLDFFDQKKKLSHTDEEVSLIAVGDISFSRGVERMVRTQNDINYPFLKIQDYLKSADLIFGNLETPITQGSEIPDFQMIFRSNPGTEQALKQAGFSIVSLANNHTPNFGRQGLEDTFNYLTAVGIQYVGAGNNTQEANQPAYIEKNGIKFAWLAYNDTDVVPPSYEATNSHPGTAFMQTERMAEAVKEAKQKANFVIVSMHAGIEYINEPNTAQENFAHSAIDAGADLIIGHHPHVVQTMEKYKDKYIFYSLGNFVFDQPQSQETKEGLAVKIYFTKNGVSKISFLPVFMENLAQPRPANQTEVEKILQRLNFPLANEAIYSWDGDNFETLSRAMIYTAMPKNKELISKQEQVDLNNDSTLENYVLENGVLTITENSVIIWQSPTDWWVDNFVIADSNNDGILDINLSLWKSGNFGISKPFWVQYNDMSVKNHFFVLDFVEGDMKQVWGSSNLSQPNCEFEIADIDNDNINDLIVIEGEYSQEPTCSGNYVAVWKWNGWGFSNEWRSDKGNFSNLEVEKINGKSYIVVDSFQVATSK